MKNSRMALQEDLFESSGPKELKRQVRELDELIARALKENNYKRAKELTTRQEAIIQELVRMGEG